MPEILNHPNTEDEDRYDLSQLPPVEPNLDIANSRFTSKEDLYKWQGYNRRATEYGKETFSEKEWKEYEALNIKAEAISYARMNSIDLSEVDELIKPLTEKEYREYLEINRAQYKRDLLPTEIKKRRLYEARIKLHGEPDLGFGNEENDNIN